MDEDFRMYSRIGYFHHDTLLEIAIDSFLKFESLKEEFEMLKKKGHVEADNFKVYKEQEKINEFENSIVKETIKIVIFLGAFLESYFFELSAVALGQQYTESHIEKLNLASKIVLIPRLISGQGIDKSLNFWGEIKGLIRWRNKIIHNKSKDLTEFFKNIKPDNYNPKPLYEEFDILEFLKSIKSLFRELDRIDQKGMHSRRISFNMERIKKWTE
ncbi:hypothetical protein [uncultured Algibacter sp.]|uniref:hypothetical protein n=1 Tax=uncultured Algibacter sp. TaxID=298659 RepID=UPI00262EEF66|nr:hypothetical protein [uncultured Algibacter sp.]